jgi:hypothetical protein
MNYVVGGNGWWVDLRSPDIISRFYPSGTIIDDTLPEFAYLVSIGPPIDAAPLTWATWFYMVSFEENGLGYDYHLVSTRFLPPVGPFILGESKLGEPDRVLGPGGSPVEFGETPNLPCVVGIPLDYWGRPMPWLGLPYR